jgi:hypothetical protein
MQVHTSGDERKALYLISRVNCIAAHNTSMFFLKDTLFVIASKNIYGIVTSLFPHWELLLPCKTAQRLYYKVKQISDLYN